MKHIDVADMLSMAREYFINGKYNRSEQILNQLLLIDNKNPEIFQMLATIYYDRGRFKKAIATFKRALSIDPGYTDASVGLSIILNDLGKYEEGKKIFLDAQKILNRKKSKSDPFLEEVLYKKHMELGDLYFQNKMYTEALDQYFKTIKLTRDPTKVKMKIVESFIGDGNLEKAKKELFALKKERPDYLPARIKLGLILYHSGLIVDAVEEWENVLARDPNNQDVRNYMQVAQEAKVTNTNPGIL